jgi:hypothetical protein
MVSCKSKAVVSENPVTSMKAKEYNSDHYDNKSDFSTLYIKAKVKYSDDRQSQNVTAEIRIKKDEQILVSLVSWDHDGQSIDNTNFGELLEKIKGTYLKVILAL